MSRVLVLTPTVDGRDGLSCLARQFSTALAAALPGTQVAVNTLAEARPASREGIVRSHGARGSRGRFALRALADAAAADADTVVVVLHAHLLGVAAPLVWRGASLVSVLVGVEAWRPCSALQRRVYVRSSRVLAISAHTAQEFRACNARLAAQPIDVCWPATPPAAAASPSACGPQPYALIVGRMSSDERYKGHDQLIDNWRSVRAAVPDAHLLIAGTGDDLPRLQARVHGLGLAEAVRFLGPVEPDVLSALYRDAAMVAMPSAHEGFGYVFLEAMAAGRPCVGAHGSAQEIIDDGTTGFIVDREQPAALVSAITRLFADRDLGDRLGHAGRRRADTVFAFSRLVADLSRLVGPLTRPAPVLTSC
ncbi:MAG: hypothetical protein A3G81_32940 [Betaproteobacteria bacterium RIFCSPLOWO2_12_FULL_65_14]|nr:MAG: hypothetical protein A3G81_32940 [Betaproteobacteria bacterium RIFCSPLOWO2_12_FULL_65_14]